MNGRKSKELRKQIYGNFSLKDVNYTRDHDESIRCVGRRAAYQRLKRNNCPQALGDQFSEPPKRLACKGKDKPRWLHPKKKDQ